MKKRSYTHEQYTAARVGAWFAGAASTIAFGAVLFCVLGWETTVFLFGFLLGLFCGISRTITIFMVYTKKVLQAADEADRAALENPDDGDGDEEEELDPDWWKKGKQPPY